MVPKQEMTMRLMRGTAISHHHLVVHHLVHHLHTLHRLRKGLSLPHIASGSQRRQRYAASYAVHAWMHHGVAVE